MSGGERVDVGTFLDDRAVSPLQRRVLALCALVVMFDGLDTQVIGYLGQALSLEWNISRATLGPVFSASLVGLMVGFMVIGPVADRFGRRVTILLSVLLFSTFTLLTAAAQGVVDLATYRFIAGIGLGGALPNALALSGEYCPKRLRATLVIVMFCGFSFGSIVAGFTTATLLGTVGWRGVFVIGGLLPLLLLPVLFRWLPESIHFLVARNRDADQVARILQAIDPGHDRTARAYTSGETPRCGVPVKLLFTEGRGPGTLMLWLVFFSNLMVFYFLQNWLPIIFSDAGLPIERAVLMTTLISFGGIVAGLITGPLMDRYNPELVLAALYLLGAVSVATMGFSPAALLAPVTFAAGFCVSGAQKSVNALAVIFYPVSARSTGVGWALGIGRFGSILGPVLGGWLLALAWPAGTLFELAAVPMLIAAVVMAIMSRRYPASGPSQGGKEPRMAQERSESWPTNTAR